MVEMATVRTAGWRVGGLMKLVVWPGGGNIAGMSAMVNVGGVVVAMVLMVLVFRG